MVQLALQSHYLECLTPLSFLGECCLEGRFGCECVDGIDLVENQEEINEEIIHDVSPDDPVSISTTCPFTKIIKRCISNYSMTQIEVAVQEVMVEVDPASITIPYFQQLVIEKLDTEAQTIYISDEESILLLFRDFLLWLLFFTLSRLLLFFNICEFWLIFEHCMVILNRKRLT